jgi:hypothetical protein
MTRRVLHARAALIPVAALAALALWCGTARAIDWPQELEAPEGTIIIYEPQPEKLEGNVITCRAAISIELKDGTPPIFGAMWFTARVDTDSDRGVALVRDLKVTKVGWPESKDAHERRFTVIVEGKVQGVTLETSLEALSASLATAEREQKSLEQLKTDPPKIVFRDHLSVLVLYDGEPRFKAVENSDYERVLNVPIVVVRNKKSKTCYMTNGVLYYESKDPKGPWAHTTKPPADLVQMLPKPEDETNPWKTPPEIVIAVEPTELICTDGAPDWKTLPDGKLLYVQNTETPWLRELATGNTYLLLSGRWFRAKAESGPWTFVRPDELPADFKNIPPDSEIGGVRTSIAGTEEAEDAMMDASIPQTATIQRSEAKLTVQYDGDPKFEKIPGTEVSYAVNTGTQVLEVDRRYYAVDNGVWFTAGAPKGPWAVADSIPEEKIGAIPPSSPVYNTTYVEIYESTPEVVVVGYYPGYMWSFPYYGVPIYGTGWYYPPYWGAVYYPHPPTWGFHVGYNPWTGWSYGVSWTNGWFSFGVSWGGGYGHYPPWGCCGGYYGGGYHRGPVFINTGDINIGNNVGAGNRGQVADRMERTPGASDRMSGSRNLYNRPESRPRVSDRSRTGSGQTAQARPAPSRGNDVYADRDGNVAKHTGNDWQSRDQGNWKSQEPSARTSEMNRDRRAREHGAARQRSAPARGGGGRRR